MAKSLGSLAVIIGFFYLSVGIASFGRPGPDFVDGVLTGGICLLAGYLALRRCTLKSRRELQDRKDKAELADVADGPHE